MVCFFLKKIDKSQLCCRFGVIAIESLHKNEKGCACPLVTGSAVELAINFDVKSFFEVMNQLKK